MADAEGLDPAAVIAAEEERIKAVVDFERHRDSCVGEINGMRRALRLLAAAGLLAAPEHDAQVAARALREAATALSGTSSKTYAEAWLITRADRIERQEGDR